MTNITLDEVTLDELTRGLNDNLFTSVDLVRAYAARIDEVQEVFRAVLEINPDAENIARSLDHERKTKGPRGPLHGVPIMLKDNMHTKDKMQASAGSYALLGVQALHETTVVRKLREAGAIPMALANMTEWTWCREAVTTEGWSARGGQCTGPYYPGMDPDGSSSGSGVAAALGLAFASLGTETSGSIIRPAERSSLVGIKPTVGLVSRVGVIPISPRADTVGPLARTVKDAAFILNVIAGKDNLDNYTSCCPPVPDYTLSCQSLDLQGIRIGVPRNAFEGTEAVISAFNECLVILAGAGAQIIDNLEWTGANEWRQFSKQKQELVLMSEFKEIIEVYLKELTVNPNKILSLQTLIDFTMTHPKEEYDKRDLGFWVDAMQCPPVSSEEIQSMLEQLIELSGDGGITGCLEAHHLDLIMVPGTPDPPVAFASTLGTPILTMPLGYYQPQHPITRKAHGLIDLGPNIPFGVSLLGERFSEEMLIRVAFAFEQLTHARDQIQPYSKPKTELKDVMIQCPLIA